MDGGSISLLLRSPDGVAHERILVQHRIPLASDDPRIQGRLYLDKRIIDIRSDEEKELLSEIKKASISSEKIKPTSQEKQIKPDLVTSEDITEYISATQVSPKAAIRHLVNTLVEFVESEDYLRLADSHKSDNASRD